MNFEKIDETGITDRQTDIATCRPKLRKQIIDWKFGNKIGWDQLRRIGMSLGSMDGIFENSVPNLQKRLAYQRKESCKDVKSYLIQLINFRELIKCLRVQKVVSDSRERLSASPFI
jgi:hypothetical protein